MTQRPLRLSLRNLRLDIGGRAETSISLRLASLDLMPGVVCVLCGESGVGKTTLLESLAGLRAPTSVDDFKLLDLVGHTHDLAEFYASDQLDTMTGLRAGPIGYVPQGGGILPFLSARQNVLLGATKGTRPEARVSNLADRLDMTAHLGKRRAALSGGQRKRVALMRGLIQPRALLLLDEPTAGLDNSMADRALELILECAQHEATSAIIVMHDVDRAARFGLTVLELARDDALGEVSLYNAGQVAA